MYKIICRNLAYIDFDKGFCLHFQSEIAVEPVFTRYIARPFGKFCLWEDDCVKNPQVCLQTSIMAKWETVRNGVANRKNKSAPRFTIVVVFPTPPFWLATAIIFYSFSCSLVLKFIFYSSSSSSSLSILATHLTICERLEERPAVLLRLSVSTLLFAIVKLLNRLH